MDVLASSETKMKGKGKRVSGRVSGLIGGRGVGLLLSEGLMKNVKV